MVNNSMWIIEELKRWLKEEIEFAEYEKELEVLESVSRKITELENL